MALHHLLFSALKVGGRLACGSDNLPSAVAAIVSRVNCLDNGRLVSVSGLALICVIRYILSYHDRVISLTLRESGSHGMVPCVGH